MRPGFYVTLIKVIGVVMVWRGLWNLMDKYILPDKPLLSSIITILVGLFLLYLPDQDIKELV